MTQSEGVFQSQSQIQNYYSPLIIIDHERQKGRKTSFLDFMGIEN